MPDYLKVTYVRSDVSRPWQQKRVIKALGFKKLHQSRIIEDNPTMRGMLNKVVHLITIEPTTGLQE